MKKYFIKSAAALCACLVFFSTAIKAVSAEESIAKSPLSSGLTIDTLEMELYAHCIKAKLIYIQKYDQKGVIPSCRDSTFL